MNDSDFTKLLTRCANAASKHNMLLRLVDDECQKRYGCSYSDINADVLIDKLETIGAEKLTASEFDEEMRLYSSIKIG